MWILAHGRCWRRNALSGKSSTEFCREKTVKNREISQEQTNTNYIVASTSTPGDSRDLEVCENQIPSIILNQEILGAFPPRYRTR